MIAWDALALGASPPDDINVLVTVPLGGEPLAVRPDERSGALVVSELCHTAMRAPGNCGLIPHTLSENADPLQAMLVMGHVLAPGMVVAARPVGVLYVAGEAGDEVTVLAVPAARLTRHYDKIASYADLATHELRQIANYFSHYRDVEDQGRPRSAGWGDLSEARRVVLEAAERARQPVRVFD